MEEQECLKHTYGILKRLRRRYITKAERLIVLARKTRAGWIISRASAWQQAAYLINEEMESIKCRMN